MPSPCETGQPAAQTIRCCIPEDDEGEVECEQQTAAKCSAKDRVNIGPGSCEGDPCAPTSAMTRCCIREDEGDDERGDDEQGDEQGTSQTVCKQRRPEKCAPKGGTDIGPGSCDGNPCGGTTPTTTTSSTTSST